MFTGLSIFKSTIFVFSPQSGLNNLEEAYTSAQATDERASRFYVSHSVYVGREEGGVEEAKGGGGGRKEGGVKGEREGGRGQGSKGRKERRREGLREGWRGRGRTGGRGQGREGGRKGVIEGTKEGGRVQRCQVTSDYSPQCVGYTPPDENVTYGEIRAIPEDDAQIWTLWIQFPVISYLDALRKTTLVTIIIDMMNQASSDNNPLNTGSTLLNGGPILLEDVCISFYDAINVAHYDEG